MYYFIWNLIDKAQRIATSQSVDLGPNEFDEKLIKIFDDTYIKASKRKELLQSMAKIKFMRFIRLKNLNLTHFVAEILYHDSIRIINEHSMRLLLDHSLIYSRANDDLQEVDKNQLEFKTKEQTPFENTSRYNTMNLSKMDAVLGG